MIQVNVVENEQASASLVLAPRGLNSSVVAAYACVFSFTVQANALGRATTLYFAKLSAHSHGVRSRTLSRPYSSIADRPLPIRSSVTSQSSAAAADNRGR